MSSHPWHNPLDPPPPTKDRAVAVVLPFSGAMVWLDDVVPPGPHEGYTDQSGYIEFVVSNLTMSRLVIEAPGYWPYIVEGLVLPPGNVQIRVGVEADPTRPFDVILGAMSPLPEPVIRRPGLVRLDGHSYADGWGQYLGLGASLMWGGWGFLHDRDRLESRNLSVLSGKVDYIRALAVVGPRHWSDRTVSAAEMGEAVAGLTDLAYDKYGLRVDWTIFGGIDTTPTPADREALVRRFAATLVGREHKIQRVQLSNEGWQNGFGGAEGLEELRRLAKLAHDLLPNLVSTTSPQMTDGSDVPGLYDGLGFMDRLIMSVHPDRDVSGTGGMWRPVRQAWDPQWWTSLAWDTDEPIGPQSSVNADDDPLRLTMAAAYTWLCGGAGYTLHTGAGIRGGGVEDLAQGRVSNMDEVAHIQETLSGLNAVRALLPADLPNWRRHNSNHGFPDYPFETAPIGALIESGQLLRAFAATAGDQLVVMPIVADTVIPFVARRAMHLFAYDPMTGEQLDARELQAGQTYQMSPQDATILVGYAQ